MSYDREEDILYLAHHLWEEADTPTATPQAYWAQAALQVLAKGRPSSCTGSASGQSRQGVAKLSRHQSYVRQGATVYIDMGTMADHSRVALIKRCDHAEVANPVLCLARVAE